MRLRYRLAIFFSIVIAAGAVTTLILVRQSTESMFRSFVFSGDAEKAKVYAIILGGYFAERDSWTGVHGLLSEIPELVSRMINTKIHGAPGAIPPTAYSATILRALLADRIVVADTGGVIVADTAGKLVGTVHPARHLVHGVPVMANFERTGTVLVGSMIDSSVSGLDERFLASITRSLLWSTLASAGIALLLGLFFTARITRPLGSLAAAARRVASGDLSVPVPVKGRDELSELSVSFNEMTEELRRLESAKKQVVADSAHELRTPVALIQASLEAMIDGLYPLDLHTLKSIHEETIRLSRLIDALRELEIIDSGELELAVEEVDLREVVRKAVVLFSSSAMEKDISISFEDSAAAPAVVKGDYMRLGEVVYNLISNAMKYAPQGGRVRVRVEDVSRGAVAVRIDDSGSGIALEERDRVFERFYRIDRSRSVNRGGRGLGLAIAGEITKAHGGSILIKDSDLGGASFVLELPKHRV